MAELPRVTIHAARATQAFEAARRLIEEYYAWALAEAGVDRLEDVAPEVAAELGSLAAHYRPPTATLLLASVNRDVVGVCGVRRLDATSAELCRLYVQPEARGQGVAWALVSRVAEIARGMGCRSLRLDTHGGIMTAAVSLYRRFGFVDSERVTDIDVAEMCGFRLDLVLPSPRD